MAKDWRGLPEVPKKDWRTLPDVDSEEARLAAKAKTAGNPLASTLATVNEAKANAQTRAAEGSAPFRNASDLPGETRAALAGVTSNAAPHILAAMEGARGALTPGETYAGEQSKALPEYQREYSEAVDQHPIANVLGAIAQPSPFSGVKAAGTLGKLALSGGRIAYAGANGAASNYLGGGADSGAAGAKSAAIQAALEAGSPLASKLLGAAGGQYVKAAGYKAGLSNQAKTLGIPVFDAAGEESLPKLGLEMADQGLIPFGASKATVFKRAEAMKQQAANSQGAAINVMDLNGPADASRAAAMAKARVDARIDPALGGDLQSARAAQPAQELISDITATGQQAPTFRALQKLKAGANKSTNWRLHPDAAPAVKQQAIGGLRDYLEGAADTAGVGDQLRGANKSYGLAAKASQLSEDAAQREQGHSPGWGTAMLGLTAAGGLGALAHSPPLGAASLASMIALNIAKKRGNAMAAPLLRAGSAAARTTGAIGEESPAVSGAFAHWASPESTDSQPGLPANPQRQPRDAAPQGRPLTAAPRRAGAGADDTHRPHVAVTPLEPTITARTPTPSVDVQVLPPTQIGWVHDSTPEEIARHEEAMRKDRMMKLARFFNGGEVTDDLQLQR